MPPEHGCRAGEHGGAPNRRLGNATPAPPSRTSSVEPDGDLGPHQTAPEGRHQHAMGDRRRHGLASHVVGSQRERTTFIGPAAPARTCLAGQRMGRMGNQGCHGFNEQKGTEATTKSTPNRPPPPPFRRGHDHPRSTHRPRVSRLHGPQESQRTRVVGLITPVDATVPCKHRPQRGGPSRLRCR